MATQAEQIRAMRNVPFLAFNMLAKTYDDLQSQKYFKPSTSAEKAFAHRLETSVQLQLIQSIGDIAGLAKGLDENKYPIALPLSYRRRAVTFLIDKAVAKPHATGEIAFLALAQLTGIAYDHGATFFTPAAREKLVNAPLTKCKFYGSNANASRRVLLGVLKTPGR